MVDYRVLAVRQVHFGHVDISSDFFDSFREDYSGAAFDNWFNTKADQTAYVCYEGQALVAFLYLKVEGPEENYADIEPVFKPKRRLKIGTFKVELNGYKLGERFLKIVFDNALRQKVDEVYVTIFPRGLDQQRLIRFLETFGFREHGQKLNPYGTEKVYVRHMTRRFDARDPKLVYLNIGDEAHFISLCRKRSVFSDAQLRDQWNYKRGSRPFIVGFLYAYSFPKRPTLKELIDNGVIRDIASAPRGFERLTPEQFATILSLSRTDPSVVID